MVVNDQNFKAGGAFFCARPAGNQSQSFDRESVTITAPPFDLLKSEGSGDRILFACIEVDARPTPPANPSPFANKADIAEQARCRGQTIEPRHVASRVNTMEMDSVIFLHGDMVAFGRLGVQRVR